MDLRSRPAAFRIPNRFRALGLAAGILFLLPLSEVAPGLRAQEPAATPSQDTTAAALTAFPVSGISSALNETYSILTLAGKANISISALGGMVRQVDTTLIVIDAFLGDTILRTLRGVGVREIEHLAGKTDLFMDNLVQLQNRLSRNTDATERGAELLKQYRKRWELTLQGVTQEEIPETRIARIEGTIRQIDSVLVKLTADLDVVLRQQDRITDKKNQLAALNDRIRERRTQLGTKFFSRDMAPLFSDLPSLGDTTLMPKHISQLEKSVRSDLEILRSKFLVPLVAVSLFFLFFAVFALWYKKHFARLISIEDFELSDLHVAVVYSPLITVLFVMSLTVRFLLPDLPGTFRSANMIIMMIPMMVIVIRLYGSLARSWMLALVILQSLTFLYDLIYYSDIILRLVLLAFSLSGSVLFIWMIVKRPLADRFRNLLLYQVYRILLIGFTAMMIVSVIGNLAGAFRMAEFFTLIPIQVSVLAIGIQVAIRVTDTLVYLVLASRNLQRLNAIKQEFGTIYRKITRLLAVILWIFFFVTVLNFFRVRDEFYEWGRRVLHEGWKIGAVDISPASILIFIFVVWLSIVITRVVRHILEKDVFARVTTSKGMPSTIILLVRIVMISGGFLLAAAAAGMELTNLSIVLGAFSVGIGFGLQNIFNNMVSGLILAFERPIKVGDIVQVGELVGVVRVIGLRSSTISSFDGSEVIVPNGNLISDKMINWTLSDSNRRMDIRVGVAYGTDVEKVIGIMEGIARKHKKVRKDQAPKAFFTEFGESSLNFRLLAWTQVDDRLEVESQINIELYKKLNDAGISIPFPQRDLHIVSDQTKKQK
jgi:small-conductance mechanosensitive channel